MTKLYNINIQGERSKAMRKFNIDELNKEFSINEKTQRNESTR